MRPQPPPSAPPPPPPKPMAQPLLQNQSFASKPFPLTRLPPPPPQRLFQPTPPPRQQPPHIPRGAGAPPPPPNYPNNRSMPMMMLGKRPAPEGLPNLRMGHKMINPPNQPVEPKLDPNRDKFTLGEKSKKNLMEDYLEEASLYNCFFPFYSRNLDMNIAKETRMRIKDMKLNPQNYFNFGKGIFS